ncbi:MAG: hypothetical protein ACPGUF_01130 [Litorivicinus sp.]
MRFWLVLAMLLGGCGYQLVGLDSGGQAPAALDGGLQVVITDPYGTPAKILADAIKTRDLDGDAFRLVIDTMSIERRELSDFSDRTEYELRATLIWGLSRDDERYLVGPETLRRDALLVLLDGNSDTLDADLERQRGEALLQDLTRLMFDRLYAAANDGFSAANP